MALDVRAMPASRSPGLTVGLSHSTDVLHHRFSKFNTNDRRLRLLCHSFMTTFF
jgi:hypothetical protein